MDKSNIMNKIVRKYLTSGDFNGLPTYDMTKEEIDYAYELIKENKVELYSDLFVPNPHIKSMKLKKLEEEQISELLYSTSNHVVLYPTIEFMETYNINEEKPFTKMLMKGLHQLKIIYFSVEVLESYYQDPRYLIYSADYRGNIIPKDEYWDELEHEYLKHFGLAYHKVERNNQRAIGVFVRDLSRLSLKAQLKWKINQIEIQDDYYINSGFIQNTIRAEFVDEVSIYDALLEEMIIINTMCTNMRIEKLFRKTYIPHSQNRPDDYRIIILPTLKNYYAFIFVLEKMLVDNLNIKTFTSDGILLRPVQRKKEDGSLKGSLVMLSEWLNQNIRTPNNLDEQIVNTLKRIRKIRQEPAHRLYSNEYDRTIYRKQNELIDEAYTSIRNIRLYFANHPANNKIEIPEYLITGKGIVIY